MPQTTKTPEKEIRSLKIGELRMDEPEGEAAPVVVTGYAAVFDSPAMIDDFMKEVIAPGAFATSIASGDVRALIDHDPRLVIGRTRAGTLTLAEDTKGLRVEITLPKTQVARDLAESMRRGDIDQMSFGFYTKKDAWDHTTTPPTRTLREVELFDVSVVTFPAYDDTSAALRSLDHHKKSAACASVIPMAARRMELGLRARGVRMDRKAGETT